MIIYKVRRIMKPYSSLIVLRAQTESPDINWHVLSQDIVTDDEIISDTYDLIEKDDAVYEVDCKKVTRGVDNIGQRNRNFLGAG